MLICLFLIIIGVVLLACSKNSPTAEIDDYIHDPDSKFSGRIAELLESNPHRADTELLVAVCELLAQNLRMQKIIAENTQRTADALSTFMRVSGVLFTVGGFIFFVSSLF